MRIIQLYFFVFLLPFSLLACRHTRTADSQENARPATDTVSLKYKALHGATMQIDPTFPYYRDRSMESIAEEVELAGYHAVHYFVVNENEVNRELIEAFHKRNMPVWLMVVGNGTYSTKGLPAGWENWKMEMSKEANGGSFTFFSLFNREFTEWKKKALVKLVKDYPFDGVEMAETYFPEWDAIRTGRYGDVGPVARKAFKEQYNAEMPDFTNPGAANYYTKIPDIYTKWMQFRVDGVTHFQNEIYNGKGGVREARPDILIATWSLGVNAGPASVEKLREDHGLDAPAIVERVKPDIHFIQTHWPDWVKPESDLPADYMKTYQVFTDPIRTKFPKLPLGFQADQGSAKNMIKSSFWVKMFNKEVPRYGYDTWTSYEYHLGGYIYNDTPKPLRAVKQGNNMIVVSFNKRIDEVSGMKTGNFVLYRDGKEEAGAIKSIKVDGNRALISLSSGLSGSAYSIGANNIFDTPSLRLYKDTRVNKMDREIRVDVQ